MANSKYEFKKLKSKTVPAKVVDSTAVRVLATAAKKISSQWKKFIASIGNTIEIAKLESKVAEATRMAEKFQQNEKFINEIKNDKEANSAAFEEMVKAKKENEKLNDKLERILNKEVTIDTKESISKDLNVALEGETEEKTNDLEDLNKALDGAGIPSVESKILGTNDTTSKVSVEPVAVPVNELVAQIPVDKSVIEDKSVTEDKPVTEAPVSQNSESKNMDPVINSVIDTINNAKKLASENQSLKESNASQAVTIASLTKDIEKLRALVKDTNLLQQKVGEYENIISNHERESTDMSRELEKLKFSLKEHEATVKQIQIDKDRVEKERDYYKGQINALRKAMGFDDQVATPSEVKTR